jgi:hypothetical protein
MLKQGPLNDDRRVPAIPMFVPKQTDADMTQKCLATAVPQR